MPEEESRIEWWTEDLTRILRSVLYFDPFHAVKANDSLRQAPDLRHYNALSIAIKILDSIIENAGLESEHDRESLTQALVPLLTSMDMAAGVEPDEERHRRIVFQVLKILRNDAEQRRPFMLDFVRFDSFGKPVNVPLPVWVVRDAFHPTKKVVFELSPQAKNIFFTALDLDLENQQVATQAMLEYQLRKGKLEEARQLAERAERLSREYATRIKQTIREAERDLERVEWNTEIPSMLNNALDHLKLRQPVEAGLIDHVETRLAEAKSETQAATLVQVKDRLQSCQLRHVQLHQVLIGVEGVFLDAQRRQKFNPRPPRYYPDLHAEVLGPCMRASVTSVEAEITRAVAYFLPARPARVFSLAELIEWQLRPKRDTALPDLVVADPELEEIEQAQLRYPKEIIDRAMAMIETLTSGTTLTEALERAEAEGSTAEVLEAVQYIFLRYFAPLPEEKAPFRVERVRSKRIRSSTFYGDELKLVRPEVQNV